MPYKDPTRQKAAVARWQARNKKRVKDTKADWLQENLDRQAERLRQWRAERRSQDANAFLAALNLDMGEDQ